MRPLSTAFEMSGIHSIPQNNSPPRGGAKSAYKTTRRVDRMRLKVSCWPSLKLNRHDIASMEFKLSNMLHCIFDGRFVVGWNPNG